MEAEFIAFLVTVQEVVWLRRFMEHLTKNDDVIEPMLVNYDSQAAIAYIKNPKFHAKTKHIDIKYHFVKDMVA